LRTPQARVHQRPHRRVVIERIGRPPPLALLEHARDEIIVNRRHRRSAGNMKSVSESPPGGLYEFFVDLATDVVLRARFGSARADALNRSDLSAHQKQVLRSQDPELIWRELERELEAQSANPATPARRKGRGSLTIVGTGIQLGSHMTREAQARIEQADKVLHSVGDPGQERWINELNPTAESLDRFYELGAIRRTVYIAMVDEILTWVRRGLNVCVVFYGHPGILVLASRESMRLARLEGFEAKMLPAISALDCLLADLAIDIQCGWQSYEATRFLLYQSRFDVSTPLILWQIGATGDLCCAGAANLHGLRALSSYLQRFYPPEHELTVYEAPQYPGLEPVVVVTPLQDLPSAPVTLLSTLYVPALTSHQLDGDMLAALGLSRSQAKHAGLLAEDQDSAVANA
jgi:Tetrapyrrole (Corrin/Porphyrin) Methylases